MRSIERWLGAAMLAAVAATPAGCDNCGSICHEFFPETISPYEEGWLGGNVSSPPPPGKLRTQVRATPRSGQVVADHNTLSFRGPVGLAPPNYALKRFPHDLVASFRVETVVGLCDPAFQPGPGASFGLAVSERTGDGRAFYLSASRSNGIVVTADFGTPTARSFPDATRVDLAIAHDGADLVGFARDHEVGGAWFEVSRAPVASPGLMLPDLRAVDFEPGQMVSFYLLRIRANAPYAPGQVTPAHEAVRDLGDAVNAIADGADALASGSNDTAMQKLQEASQHAQDAVVALDAAAAAPGKKPSRAARALKKARKGALKAAKKFQQAVAVIDTGHTDVPDVLRTVKRVSSAGLDIAKAADAVLPEDLRAAIGGQTLKQYLGR